MSQLLFVNQIENEKRSHY